MKDRGVKFEADREDPLEEFKDDLFRDHRKWAVLIVLVGFALGALGALGAVVVVLWR